MLARRRDRPDHPGRIISTPPPRGLGALVMGLALAIQFLTVLPVLRRGRAGQDERDDPPPSMAAALPWFPLVGALIGAVLALLDWALHPILALGVRGVIVLIVAAGITGMLHLDGFLDCCDALLGARSVERRLDILRDSRVGAYGVIGGGLLLLLLYAALIALSQPEARVFALIAAPLLGRLGMVYAVMRYPYARPAGVGTPFRAQGRHLAWALALGGSLLVILSILTEPSSLPPALLHGALTAGVALAVALIVPMWMSRRLGGGLTGDTYGALNECIEVAVLALTPLIFTVASQLAQVLAR